MDKRLILTLICSIVCLCLLAQFESGRVYKIETRSTGRWLSDQTASTIKFDYSRSNSEWQIIDNGDGSHKIENTTSGEVLSVEGASMIEDAVIFTETWTGAAQQKWTIVESDFYYKITNVNSSLVLSAIDELPVIINSNPDSAYYDSYSSIGKGVQKTDASLEEQQYHIAQIKDSLEEVLVVPELGWKTDANKEVILVSNTSLGSPAFDVINKATSTSVLSGNMVLWSATSTWGQYYYKADLSSITTAGNYKIVANDDTTHITIDDDIYLYPKNNKGGTLRFTDIFDGFWAYNSLYPATQTIKKATLEMVLGEEVFTVTGTYDVEPYGWFDAHSRDSKLARTAKAVADMCLARMHTINIADQTVLDDRINYGLQQLFRTQNADGSWPAGRIREAEPPRINYYWTTNVDVNATARMVRAMAMAYQLFNGNTQSLADSLLSAAEDGWEFVIANVTLVDENLGISWRGQSVDILAAAVEMAYATDSTKYFTTADSMFNNSTYSAGTFGRETGSYPSENSNAYSEMDNGTIPSLCRYYSIAKTQVMKDRVELVINDFMGYWLGLDVSPFGFPQAPLDRTTDFGNVVQVARLSFAM